MSRRIRSAKYATCSARNVMKRGAFFAYHGWQAAIQMLEEAEKRSPGRTANRHAEMTPKIEPGEPGGYPPGFRQISDVGHVLPLIT